jgi:hypothetical protein
MWLWIDGGVDTFGIWRVGGLRSGIVELMKMQSRKYISRHQIREVLMNVVSLFK